MEENQLKLTLGDWLWNASVTGFINIIGRENVNIKGNSVQFPVNCLEDFEEKYFDYFIRTYERMLPWYRIVSCKNEIENYREREFETLDLKKLKEINTYIKDTVKRYLTSNSFQAAFDLIGDKESIQKLEKELQKIKEPKEDKAFVQEKSKIIEDIEKQFNILAQIIEYCGSEKGRRYIGAKNVIYHVIKNAWNGVCFLNPQTKVKDMYEDYKTYFVDTAREHIQADDSKYKYDCFNCGTPMKDFSNDLSFVNQSGFDTARKPSHVWEFVNDVAVCPLCKLVYSCLPAGFVYAGGSGIYINANVDMEDNCKVNSNLKADILQKSEGNYSGSRIYWALVNALKVQNIKKEKFELADVQIIRYENENYRFNLLPSMTIRLINDFNTELIGNENVENKSGGLLKTTYKEGKETVSIYEQVLNHIFNNQNLFLFINKLLHYMLASPNSCFFHTGHIMDMLKINTQLIRNLGGMESMEKERDYLTEAGRAGYYLRVAYLQKDPKTKKISGISYRLLNALKTGNRSMFMDLVLNCYLYVGKRVPDVVSDILKTEDEVFATIGYAFVTDFIDGEKSNKDDNGNIESGEEKNG